MLHVYLLSSAVVPPAHRPSAGRRANHALCGLLERCGLCSRCGQSGVPRPETHTALCAVIGSTRPGKRTVNFQVARAPVAQPAYTGQLSCAQARVPLRRRPRHPPCCSCNGGHICLLRAVSHPAIAIEVNSSPNDAVIQALPPLPAVLPAHVSHAFDRVVWFPRSGTLSRLEIRCNVVLTISRPC